MNVIMVQYITLTLMQMYFIFFLHINISQFERGGALKKSSLVANYSHRREFVFLFCVLLILT